MQPTDKLANTKCNPYSGCPQKTFLGYPVQAPHLQAHDKAGSRPCIISLSTNVTNKYKRWVLLGGLRYILIFIYCIYEL